MLWIRAHLLPAYCITGFITVSGLIGVVTNTFLENYYHQMHELTLNLLPKWLRQFRLYVLWSARIELLPLLPSDPESRRITHMKTFAYEQK